MVAKTGPYTVNIFGVRPSSIAGVKDTHLMKAINRRIARFGKSAGKEVAKAMYTAALAILVPAVKARIKANRSVFRGQLHQRINARVNVGKGISSAGIEFGALGVPYGRNVEEGAPAHSPDAKKVYDYVKKKMRLRGDEAMAVYIEIMHTIQTEGSKPHPFLMPTWESMKGRWRADFLNRLRVNFATWFAK